MDLESKAASKCILALGRRFKMRVLLSLLVALSILSAPAFAQDGDKGFIAKFLEDSLAGEGRTVQINGFRGALSRRATVSSIVILDDDGPWLRMDDLALSLNRSALLRGRVEVDELSAALIEFSRFPIAPESELPPPEAQGFSLPELPVSVDIKLLKADKIILGSSILGEPAELELSAALSLINGEALAKLSAKRVDQKRGEFEIDAGYLGATEEISLDITLDEAEGGIAARILGLPGSPSTEMSIQGKGPLRDFSTTLTIATDGQPRLSGDVTIVEVAVDGEAPSRGFEADISGDVTALFAPQYRPFFGDAIALEIKGARADDGSLEVERLQLMTKALQLSGNVRLNKDFWPEKFDLSGEVSNSTQAPVVLPISGPETTVRRGLLDVQFDQRLGDTWTGQFRVSDFTRDGIAIEQTNLTAGGNIDGQINAIGAVSAVIDLAISGIDLNDSALNSAVGSSLSGSLNLSFVEGNPLELRQLEMRGADYGVTGEATISDLAGGLETDLDIRLSSQDVSRFSDISGRELEGSADVKLEGSINLGGSFDLTLDAQTRDLRVDEDQADKLLRGRTDLSGKFTRDKDGMRFDELSIENDQLKIAGSGVLASDRSDLTIRATVTDTNEFSDALLGPASVEGTAQQRDGQWSVDVEARGPFGSTAKVDGLATGPDARLGFTARMPDISPLVPKINGPLSAQGTVSKAENDNWAVESDVQGPSGMAANVQGEVATDGFLNLGLSGQAPLALANPFLAPRSLSGDARFDLRVDGPPALSSVSGSVRIGGGRAVAPNLKFSLQNISSTIDIARQQAQIELRGQVSSGGTLQVSGPIGLTGPLSANLRVALNGVVVEDPILYRTTLDGAITIVGPISTGARVAGQIDVGETLISIPSSGISSFGTIPNITHINASPKVRRTLQNAGLGTTSPSSGRASGPAFPLNIQINAPSRIFVRGRGLDAELGGRLRLTGTTANLVSAGRFELVRGRLDILSKRFELDEGIIQLQGDLDPFLRFVAVTDTDAGSASVVVEGSASDPQVRFESSPDAPQDEVLAQIFFGRDVSQISALQALQLASAVATLAGRGGEGVVSKLRRGFDLDDLDIITDEQGNAGLRAGKYISDNVYTDVTIGAESGPEISLNIDLTPTIKATGKLGTDRDTSLGIYFEKDY